MYKICVYAICKNESKFVDQWLQSMKEADYIVVLDTGSTDNTLELLQNDPRVTRVEQKIITPWRFDVGRNESMKLIPEDTDICVCTDLDEVFLPGWADKVRAKWGDGVNRLWYNYAWSHNALGEPQDAFKYDKIHTRDEFHWEFPVHEVLAPNEGVEPKFDMVDESVWLYHYPDKDKPRAYYFDLLKMAVDENPDNPHTQMLYAREFLVNGQIDEGITEFLKTLKMQRIDEPAFRLVLLNSLLQLALTYESIKNFDEALWYAQEFIKEDYTYREPYLVMAEVYNQMKMYTLAEGCVRAAKEYGYRHYSWVERASTYLTWLPDVASVTQFYLGKFKEAVDSIADARVHDPEDVRLIKNQNLYLQTYIKEVLEKKDEQEEAYGRTR